MLNEIIKKYERFSDALIHGFDYKIALSGDYKGSIEILLNCTNSERNYEWELVKLTFINVIAFRFVENKGSSSILITDALLEELSGIITVDFFPDTYAGNILKENKESDLVIKCKSIKYDIQI